MNTPNTPIGLLLSPAQALALLDATAACMDDKGHVSKKWFPDEAERRSAEQAIDILRTTCLACKNFGCLPRPSQKPK